MESSHKKEEEEDQNGKSFDKQVDFYKNEISKLQDSLRKIEEDSQNESYQQDLDQSISE